MSEQSTKTLNYTDGIFHPLTDHVFTDLKAYLAWYQNLKPREKYSEKYWVGLLINKKNWEDQNLAVETMLIQAFENKGYGVIPVFNVGSREPESAYKDFTQIVAAYFSLETLLIDALINSQIFLATDREDAQSILEQAVQQLEVLNIPVCRPIISYVKTPEAWLATKDGLRMEIPWSYTAAEMQGMIEPQYLGGRNAEGIIEPVSERIDALVERMGKWMALRRKRTSEKKAVIVLHNAPCSGVEATVGLAAGMNALESAVGVLKRLKAMGWQVENVPENGKDLYAMIAERKAWSDFRWTSVEAIEASGGCLYKMPMEGNKSYLSYYHQLDPMLREQMETLWGMPPGEGMVLNGKIAITGLCFGNVVVMVQPKRGCYGAKCTGEVCKILQDPECPPPHSYLAAYRYIEDVFAADAVIHFGTHGSLEFLPGKSNALSHLCWSDAVLGNVPNLYVYNAGVGTEGIVAKRRSRAVTVDHLPAVCTGVDENMLRLAHQISEYQEACQSSDEQAKLLKIHLQEHIESVEACHSIMHEAKSFEEGLVTLKAFIQMTLMQARNEQLHCFGEVPDEERCCWYMHEVFTGDDGIMALLESWQPDLLKCHTGLFSLIQRVVEGCEDIQILASELLNPPFSVEQQTFFERLVKEIRHLQSKIQQTEQEMDQLMRGLNGGYIAPGPSGWPDENGRNILPTGRNLYLLNVEKVPTRAAYEVGQQMAEKMLAKFLEEEGRYPENVAVNMLSLDISRAKGEQFSQVLYLLGIQPIWDKNGNVKGLQALTTEELGRPRIDVTVRITGVLRDTYPSIYELLDEAVLMAANQSEPEAMNYVRKQTRRIAESLKASGMNEEIERRSTLRIFGDRPGTFGAGVDLALKASAWEEDADLAKTFVYFSAFAYGKDIHGNAESHAFVETAKHAEIAYDSTDSKRFDLLASSFGASVQGGFRLLRKVTTDTELKQYQGNRENKRALRVDTLKEALEDTAQKTLLNPFWKANMKKQSYEGAAQLMQRMQHVFEWQCTTEAFEDTTLDQIVTGYINDKSMQQWFQEHNPYAFEEAARRYLELYQRGRWKADPEVLGQLQESYLAIEGDMEEQLSEDSGDIQGGQVEIVRDSDVDVWHAKMKETEKVLERAKDLKKRGE